MNNLFNSEACPGRVDDVPSIAVYVARLNHCAPKNRPCDAGLVRPVETDLKM
jgi:hypothetical protein